MSTLPDLPPLTADEKRYLERLDAADAAEAIADAMDRAGCATFGEFIAQQRRGGDDAPA